MFVTHLLPVLTAEMFRRCVRVNFIPVLAELIALRVSSVTSWFMRLAETLALCSGVRVVLVRATESLARDSSVWRCPFLMQGPELAGLFFLSPTI
jgi:hypothetical protein